jgi:hypothetical protein
MSSLRKLLPLLVLSLLPACGKGCSGCTSAGAPPSATASASAGKHGKHKRKPKAPPPPAPTSSALAPGEEPRWLRQALKRKPTVAPGDLAWVVAPLPGLRTASFGVMAIDSAQEDSVTAIPFVLKDGKPERDAANKLPKAPASLVTSVTPIDPAKIKPGDLVVANVPGFRTTPAQVVKVDGKTATVKFVKGDKVVEEPVEFAVPLAKGVQPFSYVMTQSRSGMEQFLVAAVINDVAFVISSAGEVLRLDKSDAKPLNVELKDRKVGSMVVLFEGTGGAEVSIVSEVVPKFLYTVKLNGVEKTAPFWAIFEKL